MVPPEFAGVCLPRGNNGSCRSAVSCGLLPGHVHRVPCRSFHRTDPLWGSGLRLLFRSTHLVYYSRRQTGWNTGFGGREWNKKDYRDKVLSHNIPQCGDYFTAGLLYPMSEPRIEAHFIIKFPFLNFLGKEAARSLFQLYRAKPHILRRSMIDSGNQNAHWSDPLRW